MPSASDVPGKFDVVINSQGYLLANAADQRATYAYTPTFVERTNVGTGYGDDQQAFWLTASMNDWSGGEDQHFWREDDDHKTRYWLGSAVNLDVQGQVTTISPRANLAAMDSAPKCVATDPYSNNGSFDGTGWIATSTNLYAVKHPTTQSSKGAHSVATPSSICTGPDAVYVSAAGSIVARWDKSGAAWTTFSATGASAVGYLNNTLYGLIASTGTFVSYDTAGTTTTIFTWKDADGTATLPGGVVSSSIVPFGSKLLLVFTNGEVWEYSGSGSPSKVANFGLHTTAGIVAACEVNGVLVVAVGLKIMFWDGTEIGTFWTSPRGGGVGYVAPRYTSTRSGFIFLDLQTTPSSNPVIRFYDMTSGAISTVGAATSTANGLIGNFGMNMVDTSTTGTVSNTATTATSGYIITSAFDFNNSLQKLFRGVTVEFVDQGGLGNTIGISFLVGDVDTTGFTSLTSSATSGQEILFPDNTTGRSICIKLDLTKVGGSGVKLLRMFLRAAPILQQYKLREYLIDVSGRDGKTSLRLRDGTQHTLDGMSMANNLITAATSTTPISITDRFGTFTGIVEADSFQLTEIRPEEFVAKVRVRQV